MKKGFFGKRGDFALSITARWILAIAILVLLVLSLTILKDKALDALGFIKNLFTFGR